MENQQFDIAVIGAGPAGLSAALTGKIRSKAVALFEHLGHSDKLQKAPLVDNYLGMPQMTGQGMMQQFAGHCLAHQPVLLKEKVVNIFPGERGFSIVATQSVYEARTVILATGVISTVLFGGEREFLGRGVSYCATCDGMLYRGRDVVVVAYTPAGEQEAEYLAGICRQVFYLPQYPEAVRPLSASVRVVRAKPVSIQGDTVVQSLSTDQQEFPVQGVFIFRQSDPVENLLPALALNGEVIEVARDMTTNIPGVFAAGDCTGKPWQVAKAVGEGQIAAVSAISYLDTLRRSD